MCSSSLQNKFPALQQFHTCRWQHLLKTLYNHTYPSALGHKVTGHGSPEVIVSAAFPFLIVHVIPSMGSTLVYAPVNSFFTLISTAHATSKGKQVLMRFTVQWVEKSKGSHFLNLARLKSIALHLLPSAHRGRNHLLPQNWTRYWFKVSESYLVCCRHREV